MGEHKTDAHQNPDGKSSDAAMEKKELLRTEASFVESKLFKPVKGRLHIYLRTSLPSSLPVYLPSHLVTCNCEPVRNSLPCQSTVDKTKLKQVKLKESHITKTVLYLPQFLSCSSNKHLMHVPEVSKTQAQHNAQAMWFNDF